MGLKFYVSEAQARSLQASQLSNQANLAINSLQASIQLFLSAPLSSKAYDSAKSYFMVAYTPLCQSAIMTGEALVSAHKKFLSEYQGTVSGIDTDEDLILEEINQFEQLKQRLDHQMSTAKTPRPDLERRYINACESIDKRREKLEKFHDYDNQSAGFFSDYEASQQEFNNGLAQVKDSKAWNPSTCTFDLKRLDMNWAKPITTRWQQREKMRQEKLKNAKAGEANTLAKHGLTEADLVQVDDPEELVYQKYLKFAALGLNPHTGKPMTDKEKWKFQYAAHTGTTFDVLGLIGGAYAANKAFNNAQKKQDVLQGNKNGKKYTLDKNNSNNSTSYTKLLQFSNAEKLEIHFSKHGNEMQQALNKGKYTINDYLNDANHVVRDGQFVPEMNGYVKLVGGEGSAKYAFVGLDRTTGNITTLHLKSVKELAKKAPSLNLNP